MNGNAWIGSKNAHQEDIILVVPCAPTTMGIMGALVDASGGHFKIFHSLSQGKEENLNFVIKGDYHMSSKIREDVGLNLDSGRVNYLPQQIFNAKIQFPHEIQGLTYVWEQYVAYFIEVG